MARLSINEAAKRFDVSRPTLLKHLKSGQISGEKVDGKGWQIDISELARVYQPRATAGLPELASVANDLTADLRAENERLRIALAVAEALAEDRKRLLDETLKLLPKPEGVTQAPKADLPAGKVSLFWSRLFGGRQ